MYVLPFLASYPLLLLARVSGAVSTLTSAFESALESALERLYPPTVIADRADEVPIVIDDTIKDMNDPEEDTEDADGPEDKPPSTLPTGKPPPPQQEPKAA